MLSYPCLKKMKTSVESNLFSVSFADFDQFKSYWLLCEIYKRYKITHKLTTDLNKLSFFLLFTINIKCNSDFTATCLKIL